MRSRLRFVNKIASSLLAAVVLLSPFSPALAVQPFLATPVNVTASAGVGTITVSWSPGANGQESLYTVLNSTDGINYYPLSNFPFDPAKQNYQEVFSGFTGDTLHWMAVISGDGAGNWSPYADAPSSVIVMVQTTIPVVSNPTNATLNLSFIAPPDNHPTNTNYTFYNTTLGKYLRADGSSTGDSNNNLRAPVNDPIWTNFKAVGLSANTAYQFQLLAVGTYTDSGKWSLPSAPARTLANAPSNVQAAVNGATSITVSWAGDAVTSYNVKNTTTGVESGWKTGTSYAFSNLACNTGYNFTVQSRNSDNVAGAIVSVTATTAACAAQPPLAADPALASVSAAATSDTSIAVSWAGTASSYFIQNSTAVTNSGWVSGNSYIFNNLVCNTTYNFTVQGRNSGGTLTATLSVTAQTKSCGSVIPAPTPTSTPAPTPIPSPTPNITVCGLMGYNLAPGDMIKVIGKPAIYVLNKYLETLYFPSGDEFKSWRPAYGGYITVSQTCFDSLRVPRVYPGAINFRPGTQIVKRLSSSQLYAVLPGNTLAKITLAAAKALYGGGFKTLVVADIFWPHYINRGADITTNQSHPGMLVSKGGIIWYVNADNTLSEVTDDGFAANEFDTRFVRPVSESMVSSFSVGQIIGDEVKSLTNKTQSE